jgi:alpha-mannosidase
MTIKGHLACFGVSTWATMPLGIVLFVASSFAGDLPQGASGEDLTGLSMRLDPTPLVLRDANGPLRRIDCRLEIDNQPRTLKGAIRASYNGTMRELEAQPADFERGVLPILVPEPSSALRVQVSFVTSTGHAVEASCTVEPVRPWVFYMTPHTHYDIGFTHPQPQVIERLTNDMDLAVRYCEETSDWPAESRYRWTVECTALMNNYVHRRTEQQVARFMDLVRSGRIEICGFNYNMPTELVGHEELIRCLYDAAELRERYNVPVDTVMINDVPGYTWALPELLLEAGLPRASFRANSIRGQFLWHRPGAVPRPCYWEGPDGSKLFLWYTDSYREGNFFRAPGLHEEAFVKIIRQNERAGAWVDHIQLRMGGDNLPPDINASKNARDWNDKYLWPQVRVATNREFLEKLENTYGSRCETVRGDIPSWWAEGPTSSARETGINRLAHDRLVAAEALWSRVWVIDPDSRYPAQRIRQAYERMFLFDEHTWGAQEGIRNPDSINTRAQWKWKSSNAYAASEIAERLLEQAVDRLSAELESPGHSAAVWNTLMWARSDLVTLSLIATPFDGAPGLRVTDTRTGETVPVQFSSDRMEISFVARDVPAGACVIYQLERAPAVEWQGAGEPANTLQTRYYRLKAAEGRAGLVSWFDNSLDRELLDVRAAYAAAEAIREVPIGGRDAINRKQAVEFERTTAAPWKFVGRSEGPVFKEMTHETQLNGCPQITQTVRAYEELALVEIINTVTKDKIVEPEGVYFAFPFDIPSPDLRVQIANAIMRPGLDQLPYTCHDFYSIQHWLSAGCDTHGVIFAPVEAPVVVLSDLNTYKWADKLVFDKAHVYSLIMSNCWMTNFRAYQTGPHTFRYRLTSRPGRPSALDATHFAWQATQPLIAVWLKPGG